MNNFDILTWLGDSWLMLTAIVAGIAVIFELAKQIKQIKDVVEKPIVDIRTDVETIKNTNEVQNRAILSLQRRSIKDACEECLRKGFATLEEQETISKQYDSYKELGGNSFIHDLVEKVKNLPIK